MRNLLSLLIFLLLLSCSRPPEASEAEEPETIAGENTEAAGEVAEPTGTPDLLDEGGEPLSLSLPDWQRESFLRCDWRPIEAYDVENSGHSFTGFPLSSSYGGGGYSVVDEGWQREDPRYIVSLGEYDISGGEIKVWIPYLLREDPDDPQRRVALPVAGASGIEPFAIGRLDSIRVGSPGGPEPANLPEGGEGAVEPPERITLSRIEFGQPAGQKHYWANREQWGTTVEIEKGRSLALGADREEGYPLDLAALTVEQKEDIVMADWNFFTTVSSGPSDGPRFYPDHEYWYWDDGFKITDPDYGRTIGIWRLNGNDIEVKLTHHEMKTYDGEGSLLKTTLVEIEGTDWETVGSLESIRIRVLVDDEGKWLHSGRITLKHHRDGVLFDKEADYWSMGGILMH